MAEPLRQSFRLVFAAGLAAGALGGVVALLLLAAGSLIYGLIVAAVTVYALRTFWRATRRQRELLRRGWFAGRRVGTHWVYEELRDQEVVSIELPLDYVGRGEYDIHVPGERDWLATMPAWARERRAEIVQRLETVFKLSQLRVDADVSADAP